MEADNSSVVLYPVWLRLRYDGLRITSALPAAGGRVCYVVQGEDMSNEVVVFNLNEEFGLTVEMSATMVRDPSTAAN